MSDMKILYANIVNYNNLVDTNINVFIMNYIIYINISYNII